jgi:PAS domain S-box-containing protein
MADLADTPTYSRTMIGPAPGDMAERVRSHDWSATPLGALDDWPQSLCVALSICLYSRVPKFIWWGPQLISLYNDAYRRILGDRHPSALGRPAPEVWPEIWDLIGPHATAVLERREVTPIGPLQLVVVRDGAPDEGYFTWSFMPVPDETGAIGGVLCTVLDETARMRSEAALAESREQLRAVLENSLDAAYRRRLATDSYDYLSPAIEQVLGIAADRLQSMPVATVLERIHPDDRDTVARAIEEGTRALRGRVEYRFRSDSGEYRWLEDHFTVQPDTAGAPAFRTGIVRDVTAQKMNEAALREAKAEAEHASLVKTQFLAVMSHELRTPLTGVIGYADLLGTEVLGSMTDRQRDALDRIKISSWHLVDIIDDILTLTRVDVGKEQVRLDVADLARVACEVVRIVEPHAAERGLIVQCVGSDEPLPIRTDSGKLRQILSNLIGNAVKYTQEGSVTVEIDRSDPDALRVHVRDTGPGIAPEHHERIFDAFTQIDGSATRGSAGIGLGLAICRRLARLLGGDIIMASEVGAGSVFTLELPGQG